ncbi:hypothetical protein BKA70DRAFT_1427280 [Coprinopsis sp. MPI-PUGE-AT-0042]|nr:hypothetical protein BKA70DRAFT_1427280 [Coprinopsis sp. MPI-PUGE-AT-0042]
MSSGQRDHLSLPPGSESECGSLPLLPLSDVEVEEDRMAIDNVDDLSGTESSLEGAPLLPDSPSASNSESDDVVAALAHESRHTRTNVFVKKEDASKASSTTEISPDKLQSKDKGKGRAGDVKGDVWGPFAGMNDVLAWMMSMPRHDMSLIVKAYLLETSTLSPKDRAEAEEWKAKEFASAANGGRVDGDGDRAKEKLDERDMGKTPGNKKANEQTGFTIFSHLDSKLRDVLTAQEDWRVSPYGVGMISSAGAKDMLGHLNRWLLVLAQHYERNVELVAMMDQELVTLETAKQFRDRDIDFVRAVNQASGISTAT